MSKNKKRKSKPTTEVSKKSQRRLRRTLNKATDKMTQEKQRIVREAIDEVRQKPWPYRLWIGTRMWGQIVKGAHGPCYYMKSLFIDERGLRKR